jgi:integrase
MKPLSASGVRFLIKHHVRACKERKRLTRCDCAWSGRYLGVDRVLATWTGKALDPHDRDAAEIVLTRFKKAIDEKTYRADETEQPASGTDETFKAFITEWTTHYAEVPKPARPTGLTSNSLPSMLGVLQRSPLGALSLADLADSPQTIERWLDAGLKRDGWKPVTRDRYYELLRSIFNRACAWRVGNKPRMTTNPMAGIPRLTPSKHERQYPDVRFDPDIEVRLLAACEILDRPRPVTRSKIDQATADTIRAAVEAGALQKDVAARHHVSPGVVCDIVNGKIWNPARRLQTTRGPEMRRRVLAAFGLGVRAGETLDIQVKHVQWSRPQQLIAADGTPFNGYEITLPALITKGGKTTGKRETVFVATVALSRELEARRFALKNNPDAYLFGTEAGRRPSGFKRQWRDLFTLAGIRFGRSIGVTWHTARHEYISRLAEDPTVADTTLQELARHADFDTTRGYITVRNGPKWAAVAGLGGAKIAP